MKTAVLLAAVFTLSTPAQTVFSPTTPVSSPSPVTSPPTPVMVRGGPAMAIDLVNPSTLTNAVTVNPNYTVPGLSALLTNLEDAVIQVLPVLSAFNDGFNSFVLDSSGTTTGVGSADNFITDLTSTNLFFNPGDTQAASYAGATGATAGVIGGPTNWFGQPIGATTLPVTRETLRSLLVLQNDLERMLPLLDTLNTGTNRTTISLTPGFVPGNFTNTFGGTGTSGTGL